MHNIKEILGSMLYSDNPSAGQVEAGFLRIDGKPAWLNQQAPGS